MKDKPVSLEDIARKVGVTRTTVSLALRNHPRISEKTRLEVQAVAEELGYFPNADLAKLMGMLRDKRAFQDRPVIALISDYAAPLQKERGVGPVWRGFSARIGELGYLPSEIWMGSGEISPKRLNGILKARGIQGVVFTSLQDPMLPEKMDLSSLACACIGNVVHRPKLHRCTSDKYANTLTACEQLWKAGCRRIGLAVPESQEDRVDYTFLSGYMIFHRLHRHRDWPELLVEEGGWDPERLEKWVREMKLDGVVAAYSGLDTCGVQVAHLNVLREGVQGIDQRYDLIAAGAVDLVDAQLRRNHFGIPGHPKTMLVRGEWRTAAPVSASS